MYDTFPAITNSIPLGISRKTVSSSLPIQNIFTLKEKFHFQYNFSGRTSRARGGSRIYEIFIIPGASPEYTSYTPMDGRASE